MEKALFAITAFADKAHGEQKRKYSGERYIVHPVKVMKTCRNYSDDPAVLAAALLHDVLEDTLVTPEELHNFLETIFDARQVRRTVSLVVELTDVYTKRDYPELKRKIRKQMEFARLSQTSADAHTIKCADIMDNALDIVAHDPDFGRFFLREALALLPVLTRGHPDLFEKTTRTVKACLENLEGHAALK